MQIVTQLPPKFRLAELAPENDWTLTVAHFNHGLRGKESDADEELVKQAAHSRIDLKN